MIQSSSFHPVANACAQQAACCFLHVQESDESGCFGFEFIASALVS